MSKRKRILADQVINNILYFVNNDSEKGLSDLDEFYGNNMLNVMPVKMKKMCPVIYHLKKNPLKCKLKRNW